MVLEKRGLNKNEALNYTGLSPTVFKYEVKSGRLPCGKKVGPHGSEVFDRTLIDIGLTKILSNDIDIDKEFGLG